MNHKHLFIALLLLICLGAIAHQRYFSYVADDAFITFRFARNLAQGYGPLFNKGESPVEGYTNVLWMIWLGIHYILGLKSFVTIAYFWGMVAGISSICIVSWQGYRLHPWFWIPGTGLLAAGAPFALWMGAGLETPVFSLVLLLIAIEFPLAVEKSAHPFRSGAFVGFIGVLLTLLRPEGMLIIGWTIVFCLVLRKKNSRLLVAGLSAIYFPLLAGYVFWRFSYYGALLPNTFYAKTGDWKTLGIAGVRYIKDYCALYSLTLAPLLLFALKRVKKTRGTYYQLSLIGMYTLYLIWVGGDFMPYFRFIAPLLPLQALLLNNLVFQLSQLRISKEVIGIASVVLWVSVLIPSFTGSELKQYHYEHDVLFPRWELIGRYLSTKFKSPTKLACTAIGRIPYYSELPTLDMLGLTDKHIARKSISFSPEYRWHEKHDAEYVLAQQPDILLVNNGLVTEKPSIDFQATSQEIDLFSDKQRFDQLYQPVNVRLPDERYLAFFISKQWLKKVQNQMNTQ